MRGFNTDRKRSEALDKYLAVVDTLFYKDTDRHVGQEQALFFLHQCDYDIPLANRLLKPWAPPGTHDKHRHTCSWQRWISRFVVHALTGSVYCRSSVCVCS